MLVPVMTNAPVLASYVALINAAGGAANATRLKANNNISPIANTVVNLISFFNIIFSSINCFVAHPCAHFIFKLAELKKQYIAAPNYSVHYKNRYFADKL